MGVKVITAPGVYLVGRQVIEGRELLRFVAGDQDAPDWRLDSTSHGEGLCEVAGRCCYSSFKNPRPGGNKAYLAHILDVGHGSVLEHAVWNFIFTGISRSLSHELVRHRAGISHSQASQRYVDESDVAFVCPPELLPLKELADARERQGTQEDLLAVREKTAPYFLWRDACETSLSYYRQVAEYLLKQDAHRGELSATERRKVVRQTARSVLPNCAETKIFCTANARALRHFLEMRCSRHADVEIRRLAGKVWEVLAAEAPNLFGDYRKQDLPDGSFELVTEHRKV